MKKHISLIRPCVSLNTAVENRYKLRCSLYVQITALVGIAFNINVNTGTVEPQVAQAPKGAVNMTLRNSVIFIRVCKSIHREPERFIATKL